MSLGIIIGKMNGMVVRAINTFLAILFIDFHWIQMSKEGWNYSKI